MGYRSDVYIAFHKELLPFWLAHVQDHLTTIEKEADTYDFFEDNSEWCIIIYECVKWYASYDDVLAVEKAFEYFQEHKDGEQYQYLRVGEEFDDVEMMGWGDKFSIDRKVTVY
jgi:hypothetical protein